MIKFFKQAEHLILFFSFVFGTISNAQTQQLNSSSNIIEYQCRYDYTIKTQYVRNTENSVSEKDKNIAIKIDQNNKKIFWGDKIADDVMYEGNIWVAYIDGKKTSLSFNNGRLFYTDLNKIQSLFVCTLTQGSPSSVQASPQPQPAPQIAVNSQANAGIVTKLPLPIDEKGNYEEGEFYKQIICGVYRSDDDDLKAFSRKVEISKDKSGLIKVNVQSKYGNKTVNLLQDKKDEFPNCINDVICRRLDTKYGRYLSDIGNLAPIEIVVKQSVFCGRQLDQFIYYTINEKNFNITKLKGAVPEKFGFDFDLINMKDPEVEKIFPEYEFYGYFYQSKKGGSNLILYVEGNEEFGPVALSTFINVNNSTSSNKDISDLDMYFNINGKLKKYDGKYNRKTKTWISNSNSRISIRMVKRANEDKGEKALCELKGILTDKPFVGTCSLMDGGLF